MLRQECGGDNINPYWEGILSMCSRHMQFLAPRLSGY